MLKINDFCKNSVKMQVVSPFNLKRLKRKIAFSLTLVKNEEKQIKETLTPVKAGKLEHVFLELVIPYRYRFPLKRNDTTKKGKNSSAVHDGSGALQWDL